MKNVMRILSVVGVFLAVMILAACSGKQSSPKAVAEATIECMKAADVDGIIDLMYVDKEAAKEDVEAGQAMFKSLYKDKAQKEIERRQGIKSFEIVEEKLNEAGDKADVKVKFIYGDGSEKNSTIDCEKQDGKWWLKDL